MEVTGISSLRQLLSAEPFVAENVVGSRPNVFFTANVASSQHVAVADALTSTGMMWNIAMSNTTTKGHGTVLDQLDAVHSIITGYYQPYTSAVCEYDVIRGSTDTDPVAFPAYSAVGAEENSTRLEGRLVFQNLTKLDVFNTIGMLAEYRLRWIELPFNGTAIGAIIMKPRSPQNATQELCIGAGWGLSLMNTSTSEGSAAPVLSQVDTKSLISDLRRLSTGGPPYLHGSSPAELLAMMHQEFFYSPIFPQRPVIVTEEWANYLNPSIIYPNTTVFDTLMGLDTTLHPTGQAEIILSEMIANGLSRIGSTSQLQGTVKQITESDQFAGLDGDYWFAGKGNNVFQVDPAESKYWVKFRVSSTVEGYAYNTHGTITKFAIGLLLAYCFVAVAHILYTGISGISSTCWDSIGEVTAPRDELDAYGLAPQHLRRSSPSSTSSSSPFVFWRLRMRRATGEHLELVFGESGREDVGEQDYQG